MSLSFGEIVEPSTRAFWDDYDEGDEELTTLPDLSWEWLNEESKAQPPSSVKRLLIFEGQGISAFVGTAILKDRAPICRLNHGAVSIYYHEQQLICLSEEKELNEFSRITEKLGEWLDAAGEVIAFSFQPSVMHKGTPAGDAEEVCFVRSLNGAAGTGVEELETPNVITGLAAGALSYRKFKGLLEGSSAYVCYLDSSVVDSASAKPVLLLLKSLSVECDDQYQLKFLAGSNLYM